MLSDVRRLGERGWVSGELGRRMRGPERLREGGRL